MIVKKYLAPLKEGMEYGPQTSQWIRSKHFEREITVKGKGLLECSAKGQIK